MFDELKAKQSVMWGNGPYEDASFDAVVSTYGVMFAPDQAAVARTEDVRLYERSREGAGIAHHRHYLPVLGTRR